MNLHKLLLGASVILLMTACTQKPVEEQHDGYTLIHQDGPTLGYSPASGVQILREGDYAFKDLNRNGQLDKYEDWRLGLDERIADLAAQLSREEIAGLMLYSNHQAIPSVGSWGNGTYDGKIYAESGAPAWALTDDQKRFLSEDNLRHLLITTVESPEVAARWSNAAQAFVEGLGHGIPVNNSSDPRHGGKSDSEFNAGAGSDISMWPNEIGMGATFDPFTANRLWHRATMVPLPRHLRRGSPSRHRYGRGLLRWFPDLRGRGTSLWSLGPAKRQRYGQTLAWRRSLRSWT
jgi:beta-glucosidase